MFTNKFGKYNTAKLICEIFKRWAIILTFVDQEVAKYLENKDYIKLYF